MDLVSSEVGKQSKFLLKLPRGGRAALSGGGEGAGRVGPEQSWNDWFRFPATGCVPAVLSVRGSAVVTGAAESVAISQPALLSDSAHAGDVWSGWGSGLEPLWGGSELSEGSSRGPPCRGWAPSPMHGQSRGSPGLRLRPPSLRALPAELCRPAGLTPPSAPDLPDPGIEPRSPALQTDSLLSEPPEKPYTYTHQHTHTALLNHEKE